MAPSPELFLGATRDGKRQSLLLKMANRHGLIAGATGTGKTVTLRTLAEGFARSGVPVFTADVKGDLAGIAMPGERSEKIQQRLTDLKISEFTPRGYPVLFWDVFGKNGHPLRTTISELGPVLLGRLLDLNDVQEGVLNVIFKLADDQGMLLLDLKDLRALLNWAGDHAGELQSAYGNISKSSVGTIQRNLLSLEEAGGTEFFGEPAIKLDHLMQHDFSGNGVISVLDATRLMGNPRIYTTFLLWLLSELFEQLPEVGDVEKPKLVFFFDEAHLLFNSAPKPLLEKVEQVVRLVRSKGVGVYFISQSPTDIPDNVLGQLGNRVQHALRAFTAKDQKAVHAAADTFRANPALKTEQVITELGVGEALVSCLDAQGVPSIVDRVLVAPPESRIGPITDDERKQIIGRSPLAGTYEEVIDRESAYEMIQGKLSKEQAAAAPATAATEQTSFLSGIFSAGKGRQSMAEAFVKSTVRTIGSQVGRQILRGIMGSVMGSKKR